MCFIGDSRLPWERRGREQNRPTLRVSARWLRETPSANIPPPVDNIVDNIGRETGVKGWG